MSPYPLVKKRDTSLYIDDGIPLTDIDTLINSLKMIKVNNPQHTYSSVYDVSIVIYKYVLIEKHTNRTFLNGNNKLTFSLDTRLGIQEVLIDNCHTSASSTSTVSIREIDLIILGLNAFKRLYRL